MSIYGCPQLRNGEAPTDVITTETKLEMLYFLVEIEQNAFPIFISLKYISPH